MYSHTSRATISQLRGVLARVAIPCLLSLALFSGFAHAAPCEYF